jgi:hypothetical protein
LRLQSLDNELFRGHASVDDMLYNPRAGLGRFYRWAPRDVRAYCEKSGIGPRIHLTAAERIAHGTDDYAPGNIPPGTTVAFTPVADPDEQARQRKQDILQNRTMAAQDVLRRAHDENGYPLDSVKGYVRLGDWSYWLFVLAWVCVAGLTVAIGVETLEHSHFVWHWWILGLLSGAVLVFGVASLLSRFVSNRMGDEFARFWHSYQPQLRRALKQAHALARAEARGATPPPPPAPPFDTVTVELKVGRASADAANTALKAAPVERLP